MLRMKVNKQVVYPYFTSKWKIGHLPVISNASLLSFHGNEYRL